MDTSPQTGRGWRDLARAAAFRDTPASIIAPFQYTALGWGIGLDWLLWQTLPDRLMLVGAGVMVLSGLYLIRRDESPTVDLAH